MCVSTRSSARLDHFFITHVNDAVLNCDNSPRLNKNERGFDCEKQMNNSGYQVSLALFQSSLTFLGKEKILYPA